MLTFFLCQVVFLGCALAFSDVGRDVVPEGHWGWDDSVDPDATTVHWLQAARIHG